MTRYALVSGSRWIAGGFESATDAMLFGASYFPHHPLTFHPEAPTMPCTEHDWKCPGCGEPRSADPIAPCPYCKEHLGAECGSCEVIATASPLRALAGGGA